MLELSSELRKSNESDVAQEIMQNANRPPVRKEMEENDKGNQLKNELEDISQAHNNE